MKELSFLEKMQILGENVIAHPFFLIILLVPIAIMFLEHDTTKKEKDIKKVILLIYVVVITIVLFIGGNTLFELFDNVIDGIFMTLYFPNFITLFVVIIISAVICLITVLRRKMNKFVRVINFVFFAIVQTLFCLVLVAIQANNIDIYKENALYSNSDILSLMQLLMGAFLLQIVSMCVVTLINRITEMIDEKDDLLSDEVKVVVNNEKIISDEIKEKKAEREVVLQARLISLKDISLKDKDNTTMTTDIFNSVPKESKKNDNVSETIEKVIDEEPETIEKVIDEEPEIIEKVIDEEPEIIEEIMDEERKVRTPRFINPINNLLTPDKPDLMKKMEPIPSREELRGMILTISNLKILKTRETIKASKYMKLYKKKIMSTYEEHPIENLKIINFELMLRTLKNTDIHKFHTIGKK